jgi:hypothetical protein
VQSDLTLAGVHKNVMKLKQSDMKVPQSKKAGQKPGLLGEA